MNNYKYGYTGPPFNFLGHHCASQQAAFKAWVTAHLGNFTGIQQFYQIRAAQLRKTSGALEQYYKAVNDDTLAPTFQKATWQPGTSGWFSYAYRDDHLPMVVMSKIKDYMREQFNRQDESVFQMNHARNVVEKTEDKAQQANEAQSNIQTLFAQINSYFSRPEYQAVLVNDLTDTYPAGSSQPRFRVHQLDAPTQWERELNSRQTQQGGDTVFEDNS